MGKLIILSLEESEQSVYDKIMKIVDEAGIGMKEKIDMEHAPIVIGELEIQPDQHKVLKRNQEISLTNIEYRILYIYWHCIKVVCFLKNRFTISYGMENISGMTATLLPMSVDLERR